MYKYTEHFVLSSVIQEDILIGDLYVPSSVTGAR